MQQSVFERKNHSILIIALSLFHYSFETLLTWLDALTVIECKVLDIA